MKARASSQDTHTTGWFSFWGFDATHLETPSWYPDEFHVKVVILPDFGLLLGKSCAYKDDEGNKESNIFKYISHVPPGEEWKRR